MKGFKFPAIVLCCLFLCWSCFCDNVREVLQEAKEEASDRLSSSLLERQPVKHVNIKLEEDLDKEKSNLEDTSSKIEETQKSIPKPDDSVADFSDSIRKMRRKEAQEKIIKKKFRLGDSSPQKRVMNFVQKDVTEEQVTEENSKPSEVVHKEGQPHLTAIPQEDAPVQIEKNFGSQNASPGTIDLPSPEENSSSSSDEDSEKSAHIQTPPHSEEMPLFDDWKKMMLAEQEKGGHKVVLPDPSGNKQPSQKRRRNYASYECGAKIVASNSEAEGTSRILTEVSDEYMLNPCHAKVWFVIELCESVQASQIELANFELFSSCPKNFSVSSSDNFPSRDWVPLGIFSAAEQRTLQSFHLKQEGYGKFIKIELLSHYGKEYYCPLSVVRIFGQSMVDEYEEMEKLSSLPVTSDDELDRLDLPVEDKGGTNLFGSATDVVYNIVKAAQALLHQPTDGEGSASDNQSHSQHCKLNDSNCKQQNKTAKTEKQMSSAELLVTASSVHMTLLQHLRHCEQCIKVSRPSYHSISEPHCRFFQAALGAVLFNSICEWYRDHHLITVTHHQLPVVDRVDNSSNVTPKPTSPPPSVINVIIEANYTSSYALPTAAHDSKQSSDAKSETVKNFELTPSITAPQVVASMLDIKPTKTLAGSEDISQSPEIIEAYVTPKPDSTLEEHPSDMMLTVLSPVVRYVDSEEVLSPSLTTIEVTATINETKVISPAIDTSDEDDKVLANISTASMASSQIDMMSDDFSEDRITELPDSAAKMETSTMSTIMTSQKESVFVKMNNRIKALELNMSLSSQYLQELSQRYRRQMEEMQRSFNRTIGTLNNTAKKAAERDMKQQEVIRALQSDVANLTILVDQLVMERSSSLRQMLEVHVFLMVAEAIIMITIMSLCIRRISSVLCLLPQPVHSPLSAAVSPRKRRSSSDTSPTTIEPKIQKRSSSEEVLPRDKEMIILEEAAVLQPSIPKGKKRNRKKKGLQRCSSNPSMSPRKETLHKKEHSMDSSAAGIIFHHSGHNATKVTESLNVANDACENCCQEADFNCGAKKSASHNKRCSAPLKNLTNGDLKHCNGVIMEEEALEAEKPKPDLKKSLALQKRDSI